MSLTMYIYNRYNDTSDGFDVSEIVHDIEYTTSILGQAGKLTFTLEKDLNNVLEIGVGSLVKFWYSDNDNEIEKKVFKGNIFTIGTDRTEAYRVVAYDQTRYLQNHNDILIPDGENDLLYYFNQICSEERIKRTKVVNWNKYISVQKKIRGNNFVDASAFEILSYCMDDFSLDNEMKFDAKNYKFINNSKNIEIPIYPKFYIRDNFGTLELREIVTDLLYNDDGTEKKDFLVIGDESLLTNYEYEVDIDKDTYNEFIVKYNVQDKKKSTKTNEQVQQKYDIFAFQAGIKIKGTNTDLDGTMIGTEDTIPKWGTLRKIVTLNTTELNVQATRYLRALTEIHNQPTRTLKLSALGYDGIYAGSSFVFSLSKLKINYPVYVISATHRYSANKHTMELEINSNPSMEVFSE